MSVPSDTATGAVRKAPAARMDARGLAAACTAASLVTMPGKNATMDPTTPAMRDPTRSPTDSSRNTSLSLAAAHSFSSTLFPFLGSGSTWYAGRNDCEVCDITSMNGLAKKNRLRAIWCAASVAGWPGSPAAALVMNPKAEIFPSMRVRTGAANFKKVRLFISSGAPLVIHRGRRPREDPLDRSFRRAGPIIAMVPASCASRVAMAAPFSPMCNRLTRK
mmetsp:Transcript_41403/g.88228  ORF Transcript_41403/g.88228 Transcript_41403/m.88228 type:complete len:219 (-) Transcript_41403:871-1527(-)